MSSRVASIDAARGTAMLFVCLSHFTNSYFFLNGREDLGANLVAIGMVASPTFVTVSGLVAGFLFVGRKSSFGNLRAKLIDRGLFLLVIGHLLLATAGFVSGAPFGHAYSVEYITDAIAIAIIAGPTLVSHLSGRSRLALALLIYVVDWVGVLYWSPTGQLPAFISTYFVGTVHGGAWGVTSGGFAVLPWFAVYLAGTVIGERVGQYYSAKARGAAHFFLARLGFLAAGTALSVKIGLIVLARLAPGLVITHPDATHVLSIYQKFPPGPIYLGFFGGVGMMVVAGVLEAGRREYVPWVLNQLRHIGLASFFVYIVQFYLYAAVLKTLHLRYTPLWPLIFLGSVVFLASIAHSWNTRQGNRILTVGLGALFDRFRRRKQSGLDQPIIVEIPSS